jgi:hypothetical protein
MALLVTAQPLHSPLGAYWMHLTSKPGVQFRGVAGVVLSECFLEDAEPLRAPGQPLGPHLRSGEPKKALPAMRGEQQKRGKNIGGSQFSSHIVNMRSTPDARVERRPPVARR